MFYYLKFLHIKIAYIYIYKPMQRHMCTVSVNKNIYIYVFKGTYKRALFRYIPFTVYPWVETGTLSIYKGTYQ